MRIVHQSILVFAQFRMISLFATLQFKQKIKLSHSF